MLYSAPVTLSHAVCLQCHGQVGTDVREADYRALSARYRLDSLVNYRTGQPIAVWLLRFPRKEVVKSIPD
jgi:cytochrome c553